MRKELFPTNDFASEALKLLEDFISFKGRKLANLQALDRLGLNLGHVIAGNLAQFTPKRGKRQSSKRPLHQRSGNLKPHKPLTRLGSAWAGATDRDHLIKAGNRDKLPLEDMRAALGLAQIILGSTTNHLHAVAYKTFKHFLDGEDSGAAIHQSQKNNAGGFLQGGILVKLIEDQVGIVSLFEVHHQPDRFPAPLARLIPDIRNPFDSFILHQLANFLGKRVSGCLKGYFPDDDMRASPLLFNITSSPQSDPASTGRVPV